MNCRMQGEWLRSGVSTVFAPLCAVSQLLTRAARSRPTLTCALWIPPEGAPFSASGPRPHRPCPPRVSSVPAATSPPAGHRSVQGQPRRRRVDPGPGTGGLSNALRRSHPGLWAPWPWPGQESSGAHAAFGHPSLFTRRRGLFVLGAEGRQRGEELPTVAVCTI